MKKITDAKKTQDNVMKIKKIKNDYILTFKSLLLEIKSRLKEIDILKLSKMKIYGMSYSTLLSLRKMNIDDPKTIPNVSIKVMNTILVYLREKKSPEAKFSIPPNLCLKGGPSKKEIKEKRLFLAAGSQVMGDISFGQDVSIWFNAVVRADLLSILLGDSTNVQDGVILHVANNLGCKIGSFVTIGHGAIVHAATLEDGVLVGMKSVVLDGAVIGRGSVIAAGAVIRKGERVEPFSLMAGVPAKKIRTLSKETFEENLNWAKKYVLLKNAYLEK